MSTRQNVCDPQSMKLLRVSIRFWTILSKTHPEMAKLLEPRTWNETMFDQPNPRIFTAVVKFLFSVIDRNLCIMLLPDVPRVMAEFNRSVLKFLNTIFRDTPVLHFERPLLSTLTAACGYKFVDFVADLSTCTVRDVFTRRGLSMPLPRSKIEIENLVVMEGKENSFGHQLDRDSTQPIDSCDKEKEEEEEKATALLKELNETNSRLHEKVDQLIESCPQNYRDRLMADHESSQPIKDWTKDLQKASRELDEKFAEVKSWNVLAATAAAELSKLRDPPTLRKNSILSPRNSSLIWKIAEENKIVLFDEDYLSLVAYAKTSSIIVSKLVSLVSNSSLYSRLKTSGSQEHTFEVVKRLIHTLQVSCAATENELQTINNECWKLSHEYDNLFPDEEYSYTLPTAAFRWSPICKGQIMDSSPGGSWIEELAEIKRRAALQHDEDKNSTPKLRNAKKSIESATLSAISLSKSVLQKQTSVSHSKAEMPAGEMIPLSASSPVDRLIRSSNDPNFLQLHQHPPFCVTDNISLLESDPDLFSDVSEFSSDDLISNCFARDKINQPTPRTPSYPTTPIARPSAIQDPKVQSAVRRPRPSLDALIQKITKFKQELRE